MIPRLEKWWISPGIENNWARIPSATTAPEQITQHLNGYIYNDYRFNEGDIVTTSTIKFKTRDGFIITKSGTVYELGEPQEKYEKDFPNAKERLLKTLPLKEQS